MSRGPPHGRAARGGALHASALEHSQTHTWCTAGHAVRRRALCRQAQKAPCRPSHHSFRLITRRPLHDGCLQEPAGPGGPAAGSWRRRAHRVPETFAFHPCSEFPPLSDPPALSLSTLSFPLIPVILLALQASRLLACWPTCPLAQPATPPAYIRRPPACLCTLTLTHTLPEQVLTCKANQVLTCKANRTSSDTQEGTESPARVARRRRRQR